MAPGCQTCRLRLWRRQLAVEVPQVGLGPQARHRRLALPAWRLLLTDPLIATGRPLPCSISMNESRCWPTRSRSCVPSGVPTISAAAAIPTHRGTGTVPDRSPACPIVDMAMVPNLKPGVVAVRHHELLRPVCRWSRSVGQITLQVSRASPGPTGWWTSVSVKARPWRGSLSRCPSPRGNWNSHRTPKATSWSSLGTDMLPSLDVPPAKRIGR